MYDSPDMENVRPAPARELEVSSGHAGRRLDKFLRSQLKGVPGGLVFRLLRKGAVRVNGKRAKPDYRIQAGDVIRVPALEIPEQTPVKALPAELLRQIDRSILHEDDSLIVLNKPADLAVHVGTGITGGVIEALRQLRPEEKDLELVHRIDKETSGLLMVARTPDMLRHLQQVMRDDAAVRRGYLALVRGAFPQETTDVRDPLLTTEHGVRVDPQGQPAHTRFRVLRRFGRQATLVRAELITGRKHQIRVHTRHTGHPIAGDRKYGDPGFTREIQRLGGTRMFLHASQLRIPLPSGELLHLTAPTSPVWDRTLQRLDTPARR